MQTAEIANLSFKKRITALKQSKQEGFPFENLILQFDEKEFEKLPIAKKLKLVGRYVKHSSDDKIHSLLRGSPKALVYKILSACVKLRKATVLAKVFEEGSDLIAEFLHGLSSETIKIYFKSYYNSPKIKIPLLWKFHWKYIIGVFRDMVKSADSLSTRNAYYVKLNQFVSTHVTSQEQSVTLMNLLIDYPPLNHPANCQFTMEEISALDVRYFSLNTYGFSIYQESSRLLPFSFYFTFLSTKLQPFWRQIHTNLFKDALFSKKFNSSKVLQILEIVKGKASLKDYSKFSYDYHTDQQEINEKKYTQELCTVALGQTTWMDRLSISELEVAILGFIPSSKECKAILAIDHNLGKRFITKWINSCASALRMGHLKVLERLKAILIDKSEKGIQAVAKFYEGFIKVFKNVIKEVVEMIGGLELEIRELDAGFSTILAAVESTRVEINTVLDKALASRIDFLNIDESIPDCHQGVRTLIISLQRTFGGFEDGIKTWIKIWKGPVLSSLPFNLLLQTLGTKYQLTCLQRFNEKVFPLLLVNLRLFSLTLHQETIDAIMAVLDRITDPLKFDGKPDNIQFCNNIMTILGDFVARCLRLSKSKEVTTGYMKRILQVYTLQNRIPEPVAQWKASRVYDYIGKCVTQFVGSNVIPFDNSILDITNFFDDEVLKIFRIHLVKAVAEDQDGELAMVKPMLFSMSTTWSRTKVMDSLVEPILDVIKENQNFLIYFAEKWDKSENFPGRNDGFETIVIAYLDCVKFQKTLFRYTRRLQTLANDLVTRNYYLQQYLSRLEQYVYKTQSWMTSNLWVDELKRIQPTIQRIEWERNALAHPIDSYKMLTNCFEHPLIGKFTLTIENEYLHKTNFIQTKENFANLSSSLAAVFTDVWNAEPKYYPNLVNRVTNYILQPAIRNFVIFTSLKAVKSDLLLDGDFDYPLELAKIAITFCFESLMEVKVRQVGRDAALLNFIPPNVSNQVQVGLNSAFKYIKVYPVNHKSKLLESKMRYASLDFLTFWAGLFEKNSPNFPIKLDKSLPVNFAFLDYFTSIQSLSQIIRLANPTLLDSLQVLLEFLEKSDLPVQSPLYESARDRFDSFDITSYLHSTSIEMTDFTSTDVTAKRRGGLFSKPTANESIVPLVKKVLDFQYHRLEKTEGEATLNSNMFKYGTALIRFGAKDSKQFNSRRIWFEKFAESVHRFLNICLSSVHLEVVKLYLLEHEPAYLLDIVEKERVDMSSTMFIMGKFSSHDAPVKEKYQFMLDGDHLETTLSLPLQTRVSNLVIDLAKDEQESLENKIQAVKVLRKLDAVTVADIENLAKYLSSGTTPANAKLKEAVYGSILYKLDEHVNISRVLLSPSVLGDRDVSVRLLDGSVRLIDRVGHSFLEDFSNLLSNSSDENLKSLGVATMKSLIRLIMRSTKCLGVLIQLWKKNGFAEPVVVCMLTALLNILITPGLEKEDVKLVLGILKEFGEKVVAEKPQPLVVGCLASMHPASYLVQEFFQKIPVQTTIFYFIPTFATDYPSLEVHDTAICNRFVKVVTDVARAPGLGNEQAELSKAIAICGLSSWLGFNEEVTYEIFTIFKSCFMCAVLQIDPKFLHPERICHFAIAQLEIIGKYYQSKVAEGSCAHPELSSNSLIFKPILQELLNGAKASTSNDITYSNLKKASLLMGLIKGAEMRGFEGINEVEVGRQQKVFEMYSEVYRGIERLSRV